MATKREHIKSYLSNVIQLDNAIQTYQGQKRDVKKNYVDNGWLTKGELKLIDQAMRLIKQDVDQDALGTISDHIKRELGLEQDAEEGKEAGEESDS